MYCPVSRAAVYKRIKEGKLSIFLFDVNPSQNDTFPRESETVRKCTVQESHLKMENVSSHVLHIETGRWALGSDFVSDALGSPHDPMAKSGPIMGEARSCNAA
jgi:hypothetical protein